MAKYIIDVPEQIAEASADYMKKVGMSIEPYTEPDRKAIEDEVWELARLISLEVDDGGLKPSELYRCFEYGSIQDVMKTHSYQEAQSRYEEWKKQKDEIRVGDEVIPMDTQYDTMIVTRNWKDNGWIDCVDTIGFDGSICSFLASKVKKTGRHFSQVAELLKAMKGEE